MLGLGLSLTSPTIVGVIEGGGGDGGVVALALPQIGEAGPSTTDDFLTQVFHTEVVNISPTKQKVFVYEVVVPSGSIDQIIPAAIPLRISQYQEQAGVSSIYTQSPVRPISNDFSVADGVSIDTPYGNFVSTPFKVFVEFLFEYVEDLYDIFTPEGALAYSPKTYMGNANNLIQTHNQVFNPATFNTFSVIMTGLDALEYIYSDQFPEPILLSGNSPETSFEFINVAFYIENSVVINTEEAAQPVLTPMQPFGVAPTAASFISLEDDIISGPNSFAILGNSILGSSVATVASLPEGDPFEIPFEINESYYEFNGISLGGNDLSPIGADDTNTVQIPTFNTHLTIQYTNTDNEVTILNKTITYTDAGSNHVVVNGTTFVKNYFYTGVLQIYEDELPQLWSGADNGVIAFPIEITNIYNSVPDSDTYTPSPTIANPFPFNTIYLPAIGIDLEDLLGWLSNLTPQSPGTSLSVIPATNDTYDATPPATQPTVTQYSSNLQLKGKSVSFGGVADLSTAYATSGNDFTFIAIGINKDVTSTSEQLIVNRKTTLEGMGLKSSDTYIKLKNAAIPTDTTPVGTQPPVYSNATPFFMYIEKVSGVISQYNEFNELVKRYSAGTTDILEIDRITSNFTGSISYIAVKDSIHDSAHKARLIEHLRVKYLDLNNINRYE